MSKRNVTPATPVSAKTIRLAYQTGALDATAVLDAKGKAVSTNSVLGADGDASRVRGRVNPAFVAHYLAANPSHTYAEKAPVDESPLVEVPRVSEKTGRPIKSVFKTRAEVLRLAGKPANTKGVLSRATLEAAAAAL